MLLWANNSWSCCSRYIQSNQRRKQHFERNSRWRWGQDENNSFDACSIWSTPMSSKKLHAFTEARYHLWYGRRNIFQILQVFWARSMALFHQRIIRRYYEGKYMGILSPFTPTAERQDFSVRNGLSNKAWGNGNEARYDGNPVVRRNFRPNESDYVTLYAPAAFIDLFRLIMAVSSSKYQNMIN